MTRPANTKQTKPESSSSIHHPQTVKKKMNIFICNSPSSSLLSPPTTNHRHQKPLNSLPQKPSLLHTLTTTALSFNLIFFSPIPAPSIASTSSVVVQSECREEIGNEKRFEKAPELVSNEEIVKEAWEIVNDSFIGTDRSRWSPEMWLV